MDVSSQTRQRAALFLYCLQCRNFCKIQIVRLFLLKFLQHQVHIICELADLGGPRAFCPTSATVLKATQETNIFAKIVFLHAWFCAMYLCLSTCRILRANQITRPRLKHAHWSIYLPTYLSIDLSIYLSFLSYLSNLSNLFNISISISITLPFYLS